MKIVQSIIGTAFAILLSVNVVTSQSKAFEQNEKLGRGINLGNALEAPNEGEWGVTLEESYFELIAEKGFNSIRVPIRWSAHTQNSTPYIIQESFFERIDWVIEKAFENDLLVIINIHHFEELFSNPEGEKEKFLQIWTQISDRYKDYSDSLLFEILNEPHDQLTAEKWNIFFAEALSIIRSSNPARTVIIGLAEYGGTSALNKLVLPQNEDNLILSVHYYNPFHFTHQGAEWVGGSNVWLGTKWENTIPERFQIENEISSIITYSQNNDIPVNIGEFGAYSKADQESRKLWTNYCARLFEEKGFSWHYWEFCSGFGIYNAQQDTWNQYLVDALLTLPMPEPSGGNEDDLVINGDFSNQLSHWSTYSQGGGSASVDAVDETGVITITSGGSLNWHVQFWNEGIFIENNETYQVEFEAWSSNNRPIWASIARNSSPWNSYSPDHEFPCTSTPTKFEFEFTMTYPTDPVARFLLNVGLYTGTVYIDNLKVSKLSPSGLQTKEAANFSVYPNPAREGFWIEGNDLESAQLFNLYGQQMSHLIDCRSSTKIYFNVGNVPQGMYILLIEDKSGRIKSVNVIRN